jgi:autophagy-related protein 17
MDLLRSTRVESSFRNAEEAQKYLLDFVDEAGVNDLYDSVKQSMDRFETFRAGLKNVFRCFDNDLDSLIEVLEPKSHMKKSEEVDVYDMTPIPSLFGSLENHATDVASHLESLVKHYDLCLSALRSTEGGGEFISKASEEDAPHLAGLGLGITNLEEEKPSRIGEQDRLNMLAVIVKDAGEVDEVVDEIRDALAEMEEQLSQIETYVIELRTMSKRLQMSYGLLKNVSEKVPGYINECSGFQIAWEDEKGILNTKIDEIEGLTEFYDGFSGGYDGLIVEVHRRRTAKREMDKIARQALAQIEKIYRGE